MQLGLYALMHNPHIISKKLESMAKFIGEKSKINNQTKQVFHFINEDKSIDQISKEIFKKSGVEIHYPIGYNGGAKYKNLTRIEYHGFKTKLPTGLIKSYKRGYGFTKNLKNFANYLDNELLIKTLIFVKTEPNEIDLASKKLTLNESTFNIINKSFTDLAKKAHKNKNLKAS